MNDELFTIQELFKNGYRPQSAPMYAGGEEIFLFMTLTDGEIEKQIKLTKQQLGEFKNLLCEYGFNDIAGLI